MKTLGAFLDVSPLSQARTLIKIAPKLPIDGRTGRLSWLPSKLFVEQLKLILLGNWGLLHTHTSTNKTKWAKKVFLSFVLETMNERGHK